MVDTEMISTGFGIAAIGIGASIGLGAMQNIIPKKKGIKQPKFFSMKIPKFKIQKREILCR